METILEQDQSQSQISNQASGQAQPVDQESLMRKADIDMMFDKVKGKEAAFQERRGQSQNKLQMFKADILKRIFMMMRDVGIDLNDPADINRFLQNIERQDPDLLALFESAISGFISPEETESSLSMEQGAGANIPDPSTIHAQESGGNLMDKNLQPERVFER